MTPELKSLIEASVVNGQVDEQAKKVILAKAALQGITEDECAIFISSVIRNHEGHQKAIKADVNYRAYSLIVFGVIDFVYGLSIKKHSQLESVAAMAILSGLALIFFGAHLLGRNLRLILKGIGWVLLILVVSLQVIELLVKILPIEHYNHSRDVALAAWIIALPCFIIFRKKIFGKKYVEKYPSIFDSRVTVFIDNVRKKIISSPKVDQFLES